LSAWDRVSQAATTSPRSLWCISGAALSEMPCFAVFSEEFCCFCKLGVGGSIPVGSSHPPHHPTFHFPTPGTGGSQKLRMPRKCTSLAFSKFRFVDIATFEFAMRMYVIGDLKIPIGIVGIGG
jgi:hypothetical protein